VWLSTGTVAMRSNCGDERPREDRKRGRRYGKIGQEDACCLFPEKNMKKRKKSSSTLCHKKERLVGRKRSEKRENRTRGK